MKPSHSRAPLSVSNWIDRLSEPVRDALLSRTTLRRLSAGEFLWTRGDAGREMFQIVSGRIRVYTLSPEGRELLYIEFVPGDCCGEQSVIDDLPRHHMAQAFGNSTVRVLSKADLEDLAARHPEISGELLRMLSRRTRLMFEYYDSVALRSVPERIANRLCLLADIQAGESASPSTSLDLQVTQEDIGYMVAASRQSVNKVLTAWQARGIVELRYGNVLVRDLDALRELAPD